MSNNQTMAATRAVTLPNGLTIVGEPMADKQAVAWNFLLPAGSSTEPQGREGLTSVLEGLCYRGAGNRDSRALSDALDDLGIDRAGGVEVEYSSFGGATLGDYLSPALELYSDIIRRPQLPEGEWQAQRELALQSLRSLDDAPSRKMFTHLRRAFFPNAYGRLPIGTTEGLEAITLEDLRADHAARFRPNGAILALAGAFDWDATLDRVGELFGDWSGAVSQPPPASTVEKGVYQHIAHESAQHHIGVAFRGIDVSDPHFYPYRVAMSVLSGGMGARLFTELREKMGLCYAVSASPSSVRGCGFVMAYVGTQPDRAQTSLDKLIEEIVRLQEGVTLEEVERARVQMLSGLVMQEESSRARAASVARDQWMLGRVRPTEEVVEAINRVTPDSVREFFQAHPPRDFSVVTLGPHPLTPPAS
jgi:predicted Zn-dependent peptidase